MTSSRLPPSHKEECNSDTEVNQSKSRDIKRRCEDYFDFAPVGYFTFDRTGVILDVNSAGAQLLGANQDNVLNQPFSAFISADSQPIFDSHRRQLFESRQKRTCDVRLLAADKPSRWVQLESVAVRRRGKIRDQFRSVVNEITHRKEAEEALLKACDDLAQRVAERSAELEKINAKLRRQIAESECTDPRYQWQWNG